MKVSDRLALNQRIAGELSKRYSFDEVGEFLDAFGLVDSPQSWSDEYDFARQILAKAPVSVLSEIVDDLGLEAFSDTAVERQLPAVWVNESKLRVFLSHLSGDKDKAARLREVMAENGMSAFVAHDDIEPTLEWQVQIERALSNMELFVSVHTEGFAKSFWTQQEVGYAVSRRVKIIAIRMGEDPTGFIQKNQALSRGTKRAEQVVAEIKQLLLKDERLRERYEQCLRTGEDDDVPF